ncbi:hypothetical protein [Rhodospirillum sp. A1_3_36]
MSPSESEWIKDIAVGQFREVLFVTLIGDRISPSYLLRSNELNVYWV